MRDAPGERPEVRAERLRVALAVCDGLPVSPAELALAREVGDDDLSLVNACRALEIELREKGYEAIERLLGLAAGREGDLPARIAALPEREAISAICALYDVGWVY